MLVNPISNIDIGKVQREQNALNLEGGMDLVTLDTYLKE